MSVNKCCCIIAGINPEGASTTNTTDNVSPEATPCKQLDYKDYANYFIVMSGDLLGTNFGLTLYRMQFSPRADPNECSFNTPSVRRRRL